MKLKMQTSLTAQSTNYGTQVGLLGFFCKLFLEILSRNFYLTVVEKLKVIMEEIEGTITSFKENQRKQ